MKADVVQRQPTPKVRDIKTLQGIARELRKQVVRLVAPTGQGYVQQGLGAADIFTALYFAEMHLDANDPSWVDRDRFLLSTAHNTAIFMATLAARGLIDPATLPSYCEDGSTLEINASERMGPVIEATCGSLGQGLSVGVGMALSHRLHGRDARVYVVLGDGEMQEGQVWEAAMAAGSYQLGNLCLIIDFNEMQVEGHIDRVMNMNPVAQKWESFGFRVVAIDGHDFAQLLAALDAAREHPDQPTCIIAKTLAGKGASSLEGILGHNMKLPPDVARQALLELETSK